MLALLKSAAARTTRVGLVALLTLGLLAAGLHLAFPFADLLRSELETRLAATLGLTVRVGRLELGLAGLDPRLDLLDTELLDPASGRPRLALGRLRIDLDLLASLRAMAPRIESVTLAGARLVVERWPDGRLAIAGLESLGAAAGDPRGLDFFLGQGRFLVADSDLYWIDRGSGIPPVHLAAVRARFENAGHSHRLAVLARPRADPAAWLRLVGDLHGDPGNPAAWSGEIYLGWGAEDPAGTLAGLLPPGLEVEGRSLRLESWNLIEAGALTESLNHIRAAEVGIRAASAPQEMTWLRLQGPDGLEGLLRLRRRDDGMALDARAEGIRFAAGREGSWTLAGRLGELRLAAGGRPPAGSTDAVAALAASRGRLAFAARDLTVEPRRLLAHPLPLDAFAGEVRWGRDAAGTFVLNAPRITAANADLATGGRLSLALPAEGPVLDLDMAFGAVALPSLRRYIPSRILSEELATWLERAFVDGTIPAGGSLRFKGPLRDFPFDDGQGLFRAAFRLADSTLEFNPDWPLLRELAGAVVFENSGLGIDLESGRFLDSRLAGVRVSIPDLRQAKAVAVRGRAEGPFRDDLRVLGDTPLRDKVGALARAFVAEGVARLDLDLAIPLRHEGREGPLAIAGELTWPGPAALAIAGSDILLTDLAGALRITEDGLAASEVEARLWGEPVHLTIGGTDPADVGPGNGTGTRILARGSFPSSVPAGRFPSPLWEVLRGRASLALDLDIGTGDLATTVPPIDFVLSSNLEGLAVALPAPLGKKEAEPRGFELAGRFTPAPAPAGACGEVPVAGDDAGAGCPAGAAADLPLAEGSSAEGPTLTARYGDLGMLLRLAAGADGGLRLRRGDLRFGSQPPTQPSPQPPPEEDGLHLTGSIATLDLPAWIDLVQGLAASPSDPGWSAPALRSARLRFERLLLDDLALDQVAIEFARGQDRSFLRLDAPAAAGTLAIPDRPRAEPVQVRLERLDLEALLGSGPADARAAAGGADLDPRLAPALALEIERLGWGDNPLGRCQVEARATPDGLDFPALSLRDTEGSVRIEGHGSWRLVGGRPRTELALTLTTDDLGAALRSLEFSGPFGEAPATLRLALAWPGGPDAPRVADLRGEVALDVGAGRVLAVEPGVGRVLGILNLEALQRRLSLDFRDLFERGFAFDKISATLTIEDGTATIGDLVIEGPAADIRIDGSADLSHQELAQTVTVTPRIGTGVAIAGAVAGGPLVGAAVLLADQVSGGAVDRLGRYQDSVTGPWDRPEIRRGAQESAPVPPIPPPAAAVMPRPAREAPGVLPALPEWLKGDGGENLFLEDTP